MTTPQYSPDQLPPQHHWTPPSPAPKQRKVWPFVLAGVVALALVIAGGAAAAVLLPGDEQPTAAPSQDVNPPVISADDTGQASADQPRKTASQLADEGLIGCDDIAQSDNLGTAMERVTCTTFSNTEAVTSTYADEATARTAAQKLITILHDLGGDLEPAVLLGPYWTINCTVGHDCVTAQAILGGEILT